MKTIQLTKEILSPLRYAWLDGDGYNFLCHEAVRDVFGIPDDCESITLTVSKEAGPPFMVSGMATVLGEAPIIDNNTMVYGDAVISGESQISEIAYSCKPLWFWLRDGDVTWGENANDCERPLYVTFEIWLHEFFNPSDYDPIKLYVNIVADH